MKIAIVWKNDYPWDVRVEKIASSLFAAGHEVYILSANSEGRPRSEILDGLHIRRMPRTPNRLVNALLSVPFYLNPLWFHFGYQVVKRERIDLIIVRDLPLILVGLWLKRRFGVPLVLDMAEDYPAMYRESIEVGGWRAWIHRIFKNPTIMEIVEHYAVPSVDHTLVVVEESAKRVKRQFGVPERRVSVVSNTPRLENFDAGDMVPRTGMRSWLQLIYAGFVQDARGLEVVVEALALLRATGPDIRFRIVGDGPYLPRLVKLVREKELEAKVEFTGWVDHKAVAAYVQDSDVGVIAHPKNDHTDTTIPNKLFDYMACGKPVVVSNAAPLERIVNDVRCGLVFSAGSPKSLAEVLVRMSGKRADLEEMGRNGAEAVRLHFHWDIDSRILKDAVAQLA